MCNRVAQLCRTFHIDYCLQSKDNPPFILSATVQMRIPRRYFALLFSLIVAAVPAWAGPVWNVNDRGTIIYHEGRGPVSGFRLSIASLIFGSEDLQVRDGRFAFTTGAMTGVESGDELFGAGGRFILAGCVKPGGANGRICGAKDIGGILITGQFLNAKLIQEDGQTILVAELVEHINPALAALLHESTTTDALLELDLSGSPRKWGWTVDGVDGGSISALSEPASIEIFGGSLIGLFPFILAGSAMRRSQQSKQDSDRTAAT
jgi:hypothetical protein